MPHPRRLTGILLFCLFVTAGCSALAGEADQAQPYEKISYPTFKNGRLHSLLEADKAMAYDITAGTPSINMENVIITLYDDSEEARTATPEDQALPVKIVITSDRGYFTRRPPEPGSQPEEIANLDGNVLMRRFRTDGKRPAPAEPTNLPPGVETEIHCDHAQWNNTQRILRSDGDVEIIQEDSRIYGTDFLYVADDDAMDTSLTDDTNLRDWGGVAYIERNARMEIDRDIGGTPGKTVITCKDTVSYKLDDREIQFEGDVKVARPGLEIQSDILKVFLRNEEDVAQQPEADAEAKKPGQVKNIIASIGKRPGAVVITGFKGENTEENVQFRAKGGRADFDYDANRITLIDSREDMLPSVEFGPDRDLITDDNLVFTFSKTAPDPQSSSLRPTTAKDEGQTLDTLTAFGGHGRVLLRSRGLGDDARPTVQTEVTYKGDLTYNRSEGRIRFRDGVNLVRKDEIAIESEILDIRLVSDGNSVEPNQISRIIAENDVRIVTGNAREGVRKATAHRAEYDVYTTRDAEKKEVDTLRLFAPPQRTATNPSITNEKGHRISAPEIHMQRQRTQIGQKDRYLMVARGEPLACVFLTDPDATGKAKQITINCDKRMEYTELEQRAHFEGNVQVDSSSPEDNYVLKADRLTINFQEAPDPEDPDKSVVLVRRITADGHARLEQDVRQCEADKIIRDFPTLNEKEGDIYLQGAANGDEASRHARYIERRGLATGAKFEAVLIKSNANGSKIEANGPGSLSVPDDDSLPGQRAEIAYQQYASYESFSASKASRATFKRGVVLRQPSRRLTINCEEMNATFLRDDDPENPGSEEADDIDIQRIGRLVRAEFSSGVRVEVDNDTHTAKRIALGERGSVDLGATGNIIKISTEPKPGSQERARIQDERGMVLISPAMEMREGQGYIRADGPGELHIPADGSTDGISKAPTVVMYGDRGAMIYNELALNIRISDRVRILQPGPANNWRMPSLDGNCDHLEISLFEPPEAEMSGDVALSKVRKMDAQGNVVVRVYADPPPENPGVDWLSRPGTTIFTRGDRGEFFVPESRIEISAMPGRQPQLLLNVVDPPRQTHRQRMKADRFILDTNSMPRRWSFHGQQESSTIREGEPFEFTE